MDKLQQLNEHSGVCAQLSERKCCIQCYRDRVNIRAQRCRAKKQNELDSIRKTGSNPPHKTKYASVLCINCTGKSPKVVCKMLVVDVPCGVLLLSTR